MSDVYLWDTYQKLGREALERNDIEQALESFQAAVSVAEELSSVDPRLTVSLRSFALAKRSAGEPGTAFQILEKTLEIALSRLGPASEEVLETRRRFAEVARELGYLDRAQEQLEAVLEVVAGESDERATEEVLESLAQLAQEREQDELAVGFYERLLQTRIEAAGAEHPSVAQALLQLSTAQAKCGLGTQADENLRRAFELLQQQFEDDPNALSQSFLAGADLLQQAGRFETALEYQKRALDLLAEQLGHEHETVWETRQMIAASLASLGQLPEAVELLEFCLERRQDKPEHHIGALLKNLGGLYLTLGQVERAEALYAEAAQLLKKALGESHPAFLATQEERVQLYHFNGRSAEALEVALQLIAPTETRFGAGHPNTAQTYASTALLAHTAGRWEVALTLMEAAERIWESLAPPPLDVLANCRANQATCLLELGRWQEAREKIEQARTGANHNLRPLLESLHGRAAAQEAEEQTEASRTADPEEEPPPAPVVDSRESEVGESFEPPVEPPAPERRRHPRRNLELNRFYEVPVGTSAETLHSKVRCFLIDISLGGMRVNSEKPLPFSEDFWLELPRDFLGEMEPFRCRVVWQRDLYGSSTIQGLEFLELTAEQRERLGGFLGSEEPFRSQGRQHYRLYRPVPVQLFHEGSGQWEELYASDLSLQGLGLRLEDQAGSETSMRLRLLLEFELPTVEVGAKVAWSRAASSGYAHGLHFQEMGPVEARTIGLYIARCLEQNPDF